MVYFMIYDSWFMVSLFQVRDALVVTTMGGGAAPPSCPAATARVTAMGPGTGAPMTATEAASEVRGLFGGYHCLF